jgi:hypothetical protein
VTSGVVVGQALVVKAEQSEGHCVQVVDLDCVLLGEPAELVGRAEAEAGVRATPGHAPCQAAGIVVASDGPVMCRERPAKLVALLDESVLEHSVVPAIADQAGDTAPSSLCSRLGSLHGSDL